MPTSTKRQNVILSVNRNFFPDFSISSWAIAVWVDARFLRGWRWRRRGRGRRTGGRRWRSTPSSASRFRDFAPRGCRQSDSSSRQDQECIWKRINIEIGHFFYRFQIIFSVSLNSRYSFKSLTTLRMKLFQTFTYNHQNSFFWNQSDLLFWNSGLFFQYFGFLKWCPFFDQYSSCLFDEFTKLQLTA